MTKISYSEAGKDSCKIVVLIFITITLQSEICNADLQHMCNKANYFNNLSAEISYGSANNRYPSGSTVDWSFQRILALVQCRRDMSFTTVQNVSQTQSLLFWKKMLDGREITVQNLSLQPMQGKKEFLNEVKLVGEIRHRNLVNIIGCCVKGSERLLVYEYLANKSLDKILFGEWFPFSYVDIHCNVQSSNIVWVMIILSIWYYTDPTKRKHLDWVQR